MKKIGETETNGILVEMSRLEYTEFQILVHAVEGKTHPIYEEKRQGSYFDFDFETTFGVIRTWYSLMLDVNELQRTLDGIKEALNKR